MQTLATIFTLIVCAALVVTGMYVADKAPYHSNIGGWVEFPPVFGATVLVMVVVVAVFGGGAWLLWRADYKMASQLLGVTAMLCGALVWVLGDALNVLLDESPPTRHETEMIKSVSSTAKRKGYFVVTSWRNPGEEATVDLPTQGQIFAAGTRLVITTRAGAFGRPYAIELEPAEPPSR